MRRADYENFLLTTLLYIIYWNFFVKNVYLLAAFGMPLKTI